MDWTGEWVAKTIKDHAEVQNCSLLTPQRLEITRKQYPKFVLGTISILKFDENVFSQFVNCEPAVSFIVNIATAGFITKEALLLSIHHAIPIGDMGDLRRALLQSKVQEYRNGEISFIERGLRQHSRVTKYDRMDDRCYLIKRRGLPDVTVVFLYEYELVGEMVRNARDRYGEFRWLVISNPNGRATSTAIETAAGLGSEIFKWGGFYSALNKK